MTPQQLTPLIVVPLALFFIYRRVRRQIGRQPLQPVRLTLRAAVMLVLGVLLTVSAWGNIAVLEAGAVGVLLGMALAGLGVHLTRFELTPSGRFYTPNLYIGLAITALLLGRLLYRFVALYPGMQAAAQGTDGDAFAAIHKSPLTFGIFALIIGYYVVYNITLLLRSRAHAKANPLPVEATPPARSASDRAD